MDPGLKVVTLGSYCTIGKELENWFYLVVKHVYEYNSDRNGNLLKRVKEINYRKNIDWRESFWIWSRN